MTLELTRISLLREAIAAWRAAGETIALVPTMGALHAGHMALVEAAKAEARRVVVSIFVNPTQFGPNEDFARYPRPLERDLAMLRDAAVDAVWLPTPAEMYPNGFATSIHVAQVSEVMEGAIRPGHFDGVATVVAKLLNQVTPDVALFGEKDYQQLCVIRRLVDDLDMPIDIIGVPTVRETDGVAMSSRNAYLAPEQRAIAPALYKTLCDVASQLVIPVQAGIYLAAPNPEKGDSGVRGDDKTQMLFKAIQSLLAAGFTSVDYLELRDADSLAPLIHVNTPARLIAAARLGTTRLIDNISIAPADFS